MVLMPSGQRICFDFQAGRCHRANCRFEHVGSDDRVLSQFERMEIQRRLENERRLEQVDDYFAAESRQTLLPAVQEMCLNLFGVEPATVPECTSLLQTCFVHISDYVAECQKSRFERYFGRIKLSSVHALHRRCDQIGYYPRERAKTDTLRHLLRVLSR
eukprot:m.118879 g.118879  ORF g.118879 m.118879 type:complete len:159 (-) comp52025_c0_seq7:84-560(-)